MDTPAVSEPNQTPDPDTIVEVIETVEETAALPEGKPVTVSDFEDVVRGALEAVGGQLLFKMQVGPVETSEHVAAAAVGNGETRQFLLLSLPTAGGKLKVETAAASASPAARIAESYAGLLDVFQAAA